VILNFVILAVVAIFVIFGLRHGFIRWLAATLGIFVGFWMASNKYPVLEKFLARIFNSQYQAQIVSFIIVFLVFFFIVILLGYLLSKIVNLAMLGWLDRVLGGVFGLINGLVFIWILLVLIVTFQPNFQRSVDKSILAKELLETGRKLSGLHLKPRVPKKYLTFDTKTLSLKS
jgi:membrane protein required for colicin V production